MANYFKSDETNSNRVGQLGIKLALVQTYIYQPFVRQCLKNRAVSKTGITSKRLAKVMSWKRFFKWHERCLAAIYALFILKYTFIELVAPGSLLEDYQFVDCMLIGRFKLIGRTNRLSSKVFLFFLVYFCIYRLIVLKYDQKFHLAGFEFLLNDLQDVKSLERANKNSAHQVELDSIFFFKNQFAIGSSAKMLLRLNRTEKSWLQLARWNRLILFNCVLGFVGWIAIVSYLLIGSVLTKTGFETSYSTCAAWLRSRQNESLTDTGEHSVPYSNIYVAPRVLASEISLDRLPIRVPLSSDDLVQTTPYMMIRLIADAIENYYIYSEFILNFFSQFHILSINTLDILVNCHLINQKTSSLVSSLNKPKKEPHAIFKQLPMNANAPRTESMGRQIIIRRESKNIKSWRVFSSTNELSQSDRFRQELSRCQALLVDHIELTMAFNRFGSFFYGYLLSGWLVYTVITCAWVAQTRSHAVETEFVTIEATCSLLVVATFVQSNMIHANNARLYRSTTRLMALELADPMTKLRLLKIMKYFFPRPLFCISIFGYFQVSWMFSLRLIFWVISVFVVLASFYYDLRRGETHGFIYKED